MLNLIRLVNDLFDDEKLFDPELRSFSEDHLVRLSQPENNPAGIYSGLITDLTNKYNAYYGKITNEATKKAIAEGTTATRNAARKAAEEKISQLQGLVKYKFGETSGTYQEFYPLGASEYQNAREGDVGTLFDRFVGRAVAHLTADYPADVTAITNLVTAFDNAYTARETAVAQVDIAGTGKLADRQALTTQLTTNFLTIAINNIGNPAKFNDYYDPRFLPITDSVESFNGTINATATITAVPTGHITESSEVRLRNNGPVDLEFSLSNLPATMEPGALTVEAGQELEVSDLPVLENYYLNVRNPHATENGRWKIQVR